MLASLIAYIPQDRRQALAHGIDLPDRTNGAALFADISGFTPLTEALTQAYGRRRGAEELTTQLNAVYDALISRVEAYGGSVLTFSGDAITCWFDDASVVGSIVPSGPTADATLRAAACALALQEAMGAFASIPVPGGSTPLALKVAIASGPARRFVVGDPAIQLIDALAGATIDRVAEAEHLAARGEIILDTPSIQALGETAQISELRIGETGAQFGVLSGMNQAVEPHPWPEISPELLGEARIRPWLLPAIYAREQANTGEFLTEFRPAAALFMRFMGIDYDHEAAGVQLDRFIWAVQAIIARYEGTLLQLTIGDKGAYLYAAFGAPVTHEDDCRRVAQAALALRARVMELDGLQPVQIGLSYGTLRTGAYGGTTRRTYGVIGDDVNLAARLMQLAAPDEIVLSSRVQSAIAMEFEIEPRAPVMLKGKSEPQSVFFLIGTQQRRAGRLEPPSYALPMVGREAELAQVAACLNQALSGQGQVVGITAEAGMGKSRLVAEVIRLADRRGVAGYGGSCRADGTGTPYHVWGTIWQALFGADPGVALRRQLRAIEGLIDDWAPERIDALPLLGPLLELPIPENEFTSPLEPLDRKNTLHALLRDCLAGAAREASDDGSGLLLVLEDIHWIDPASRDLLRELATRIADLPVLLVLAYRPGGMPLDSLADEITLAELNPAESTQAIRAKLAQLFPERAGVPPAALFEQLMSRAQGNPFYLEELLNYLRDRGIDPHDTSALETLDLPNSLHSLILSRIDQLSAHQQLALKVASVLGRRFGFMDLQGVYPGQTVPDDLRAELDQLSIFELTSLDAANPELTYLFKHVATQEVAYESLAYATRAVLHAQVGVYLERNGSDLNRIVDLLAYHYERSENLPKKRYYLRRAGEIAATRYANDAALSYLSRALALAPRDDLSERYSLLHTREQVYALLADREAQHQDLAALEELVGQMDDNARRVEVAIRRANYAYRGSDYGRAAEIAEQATLLARSADVPILELHAQLEWVWALIGQGEYQAAQSHAETCMRQAETVNDQRAACKAYQALGEIAGYQGDLVAEQSYLQQLLELARTIGDLRAEGGGLNNLGAVAGLQGDFAAGQAYLEQNLRIAQKIGDRRTEGFALSNLGYYAMLLGDYAGAQSFFQQGLQIMQVNGHRSGEANTLGNLSMVAHYRGDDITAERYGRNALEYAEAINDPHMRAFVHFVLGDALAGLGQFEAARAAYQAALEIRRALQQPQLIAEVQAALARVALEQDHQTEAMAQVEAILVYLEQGGTLDGAEHPLQVLLRCYEVLAQMSDSRAAGMLANAHTALQERAARISDAAMRDMFLEQVPYHQAIRDYVRITGGLEGAP